mmetsp:Transcript_30857/g.66523  ORF Transcript_30857/g.66523 Transcript_30857/m.66523 type:complete len:255 (+) Transcript_30857:414-1178(+)
MHHRRSGHLRGVFLGLPCDGRWEVRERQHVVLVRPLRGPGPGGCLHRGLDCGHRRAARGELRGTQGGAERALALEGANAKSLWLIRGSGAVSFGYQPSEDACGRHWCATSLQLPVLPHCLGPGHWPRLVAASIVRGRCPAHPGNLQGEDGPTELHFGGLGLRDPAAPDVDQDRLRGGGLHFDLPRLHCLWHPPVAHLSEGRHAELHPQGLRCPHPQPAHDGRNRAGGGGIEETPRGSDRSEGRGRVGLLGLPGL